MGRVFRLFFGASCFWNSFLTIHWFWFKIDPDIEINLFFCIKDVHIWGRPHLSRSALSFHWVWIGFQRLCLVVESWWGLFYFIFLEIFTDSYLLFLSCLLLSWCLWILSVVKWLPTTEKQTKERIQHGGQWNWIHKWAFIIDKTYVLGFFFFV